MTYDPERSNTEVHLNVELSIGLSIAVKAHELSKAIGPVRRKGALMDAVLNWDMGDAALLPLAEFDVLPSVEQMCVVRELIYMPLSERYMVLFALFSARRELYWKSQEMHYARREAEEDAAWEAEQDDPIVSAQVVD